MYSDVAPIIRARDITYCVLGKCGNSSKKKAQKEGFMLFMWLDDIRINTELTIHIEINYFLVLY